MTTHGTFSLVRSTRSNDDDIRQLLSTVMMMMMMMMMMMLLNNPGLNFIESGVALWAVTRYIILVKEQNVTGRSDVEAQVKTPFFYQITVFFFVLLVTVQTSLLELPLPQGLDDCSSTAIYTVILTQTLFVYYVCLYENTVAFPRQPVVTNIHQPRRPGTSGFDQSFAFQREELESRSVVSTVSHL